MENRMLLILLLFGVLSEVVFCEECLVSSLIHPCTFRRYDSRVYVNCVDIKDAITMKRILEGMKGCKISQLQFIGLQLNFLPRGIFNGTWIDSLVFTNSSLYKLAENGSNPSPFLGLENIIHTFGIGGAKNSFQNWNWCELSNLSSLETLSLARSGSLKIIPRSFSCINGTSIRRILITGSCLQNIKEFAFSTFHQLESIYLEGNELYLINRLIFPARPEKLALISLRNNYLGTLDSNTFNNMPALKKLYLEGNRIQIVQQNVFFHIWNQLDYLLLYENPIICDCRISWIIGRKVIYEKDNKPFYCDKPSHLKGTIIRYLDKKRVCS